MKNLFAALPSNLPDELVERIVDASQVRIERIVSTGHASPKGFWYDQDEHEWVIVLRGEAKLLIEGDNNPVHMRTGDYVTITAHQKHRVEWTSPDEPTVWLAVFYERDGNGKSGINRENRMR